MSEKQELTQQEKELLDFIAAMFVQVVINETKIAKAASSIEGDKQHHSESL